MEALQQTHEEIRALGAELVAVSPQMTGKNAEVKERHKLGFPVLSDPGHAWARQLGLVFTLPAGLQALYTKFGIMLPEFNGDDSWELPLPARLVVDGQGVIRSIDAGVDYTRRPEAEASVEVLKTIG